MNRVPLPDNFPELPPPDLPLPPAVVHVRRPWRSFLKLLLVVTVLLVGVFSYEVISSGGSPREVFRQLTHLITSRDRELRGEAEGRTNVLLLGMGGEGHEGPLLTDTLLLVSVRPQPRQAAFISIPRDLLVEIPGHSARRINTAYALAEITQPGSGGAVASDIVGQVFGLPVHYYARVDFTGFVRLIDAFGGITVEVVTPLDDEFYPVPGKETAPGAERYEHLSIPAGRQRFDGALALKYVRSRKAKGAQGSDFARSFRQQQVITAIHRELTAFHVLRPAKFGELLQIVQEHLDTNLQLWEVQRLYSEARDLSSNAVFHHVLDDRPDGLLVAQLVAGAYVLIPRGGDFTALHQLGANPFQRVPLTGAAGTNAPPSVPAPVTPATAGKLRLQVDNGTDVPGLAARTERYLLTLGYEVVAVGNAPVQSYVKTVVYDLKPPAAASAIRELSAQLKAIAFPSGPPASPAADASPYPLHPDADALLIVGQDLLELLPEP